MKTIAAVAAGALTLLMSALATAAAPTPTAVTITAAPRVVVYGAPVVLTGSVTPPQANERVTVRSQPCGQSSMSPLTTATTNASGTWSATATPTANTLYQARVARTSSPTVSVQVRPRVRLAKIAPRRYRVRVSAAESFAGKFDVFQRYAPGLGRWVRVRTVVLAAAGTGTSPTVISGATFRSSIRRGTRVRALLPASQVGACYLGGWSNIIRS